MLSPSNPFHHMNASSHAGNIMDFGLLDSSRKTRNHGSFGSEIEFQPQICVEDGVGACSPPLWNKKNESESTQNETSPLLLHDHCLSHPSRASQLERMAEGRRELMEIISNMSESTYELSLKDIVDEQHTSQDVPEEGSIEERSMSFNSEIHLLQQKSKTKRKNIKPRQITRSASMENEVFLLKMFFPTLGMKRKSATRNSSKVSQKSLCDKPEDNLDKEWWKKRFLGAGQRKNGGKNSIWGSRGSSGSSGSSSRSNSNKSRQANGVDLPGCWPFFRPKKAKPEDREDYSHDRNTT